MTKVLPNAYSGIPVPAGSTIRFRKGNPVTPLRPIIPFIEGDGIGPEIWSATRQIVDTAVRHTFGDKRQIVWYPLLAGDKATAQCGEALPADSLAAIKRFRVAIKGPLRTPTGEGIRSLNVLMRRELDLFCCVRPLRYFNGVPSPMKEPEKVDLVIFRENVEDVYAGIEYAAGSHEANQLTQVLTSLGAKIREGSAIGIKPMSEFGCKRLIRSAIQYAIEHNRPVVTLVHKGNIQKFTEGAFCKWGYEVAAQEFGDVTVTEKALGGKPVPEGKILINDRIADAMFAAMLTDPERYSVLATTNLNGDYFSDSVAAQVGGLGIAPGANLGDRYAIFEAVHGIAEDRAGQNVANPCSLLLSAVMMLDFLGWTGVGQTIRTALQKTIDIRTVTSDFARKMPGATALSTTAFTEALVGNIS